MLDSLERRLPVGNVEHSHPVAQPLRYHELDGATGQGRGEWIPLHWGDRRRHLKNVDRDTLSRWPLAAGR